MSKTIIPWKAAPLGLLKIAAIVIAVLFFTGAVAAGALPSTDKPMPPVVPRLHQSLPVLALLPITETLYLLLRSR